MRDVTKWIGPCFHPDTRARDYITGGDRRPLFSAEEADKFDRDIDRAFEVLAAAELDPYAIAFRQLRKLLMC
jgi:hypothetical protein